MFDAVIVGGGPAGSTCAARLAALGRRVLVLEELAFPRFRLGESLLPCSLDVLDTIGVLNSVSAHFQPKFGACFHDDASARTARFQFSDAFGSTSPHAFQVPRDEFDALLLAHAASAGAEVRHGWSAKRIEFDGTRATGVIARAADGAETRIPAKFVVDATGRSALVAHARGTTERIPKLDKSAFFAHYRGVAREEGERAGDIQIVLFGGLGHEASGWAWLIPFKDGRTSVGAVMSSAWVHRGKGASADELLRRAIADSPSATRLLAGADLLWTGRATADFSFRVREMTGDGWIAVGDAGGFIDPLFSTGVHIALVGGVRGAEAIDAALASGDVRQARFADFERTLRGGTEMFIAGVRAFYEGKLQAYLFAADKRTYLRRAITSMLAGDVFRPEERWLRDLRVRLDALVDGPEVAPPSP